MGQKSSLHGNYQKKSDNFGTPSENFGNIDQSNDPQELIGPLKRLSLLDTDENTVQANFQGVGIKIVKKTSPTGICQPH